MKKIAAVIALCLFTVLLFSPRTSAQANHLTAIRCGQVLEVESGKLLAHATILVRGTQIESIAANAAAPVGAQSVDLASATCLPGLMDLHAHFMYNYKRSRADNYLTESSAYKALYGLTRVQEFLRTGFTTLRDPSDFDKYFAMCEVRDAIARGDFLGPRIFAAPHALGATSGHADLDDLAPDVTDQSFGIMVKGADSAREAVRYEIKYGADWIKMYVSGGVLSALDNPRVQQMTREEVEAAVDEAHRYKKKVCVHAIGTEAIKTSIRAGVDSVEHGILIDDEGIQLMKQRGTYLVPTLYVLNYIVEEGPKMGIPEDNIAKARSIQAERDVNIRKAFAAGVKVAYGSDTVFPVAYVPREFPALVKLGLTPLQAIQAATINSATLLGIQGEVGTLQPGKLADIIAVAQNPLDDVTSLGHVKFVMKSGQIIKNDF